jgi:RES domain-containing protein
LSPHRKLSKQLKLYRIGDPSGAYPIFSAEGAVRQAGRWHLAGDRVIYACKSYATAMLEKLVYYNSVMPPGQHFLEIEIPSGISYEMFSPASLPHWAAINKRAAQSFGHQWYTEKRSCILIVPSVVAREEQNVVINEQHDDFRLITTGLEEPITWDRRLFT